MQGVVGSAAARTQSRAVGSSTVYPFTTAVAEQFVQKNPKFKPPIVESTGTGGGFKLFCGGVGAQHPDVSNASRRIKVSEVAQCSANGVTNIKRKSVVEGNRVSISVDLGGRRSLNNNNKKKQ